MRSALSEAVLPSVIVSSTDSRLMEVVQSPRFSSKSEVEVAEQTQDQLHLSGKRRRQAVFLHLVLPLMSDRNNRGFYPAPTFWCAEERAM